MSTRTYAGVAILALIGMSLAVPFLAAEASPETYVTDGLQRISLQSLRAERDNWEYSRAIAAATILAWFRDQGFVAFLDDWTEDGVIDGSDTIRLAEHLAATAMNCEQPSSEPDAQLVVGLAQYVADRYPDVFELRIYDLGFSEEFEQISGDVFSPDAIPGITIVVGPEPTFDVYESELMAHAGVIVGLEQAPGHNLYFTGHSSLKDPTGAETYGMGLLSPQEDWFAAGTQGTLLKMTARQLDVLLVEHHGLWMKAETIVALHSRAPRVYTTSDVVCADGTSCTATVKAVVQLGEDAPLASAFDLVLEVTNGGSTRTFVKTVAPEEINPTGSVTLVFTFPIASPDDASAPCTYSLGMGYLHDPWAIAAALATGAAVPVAIHGDESANGCYAGGGCCENVPDCLDLIIRADCQRCDCEDVIEETWHPDPLYPQGGWWETEVVDRVCEAEVRCIVGNLGTIDTGSFSVTIETSSGHTETEMFESIAPGGDGSTWFEFTVEETVQIIITIIADSRNDIAECDEGNNTAEVRLLCF